MPGSGSYKGRIKTPTSSSAAALQNTLANFKDPTKSSSAPTTESPISADLGLEQVVVTAKKIKSKNISADILPNILDDYDMYTYHFRLYMVSDEATMKRDFGPTSKSKKIVIAESGATTIGIDDVRIESIIGFTKQTGSTTSTRFSFTLTQPFGATLLDYINLAARELKISNFLKAPFYLELSFRARNPNAPGTKTTSIDDAISNLVWVWPLMITKTAISVNAGGSTYAVEAVFTGDLAYTNQAADLEIPVSIDATTVEDFFKGLKEALEKKESQKDVSQYQMPDVYEFYIDEDIAKERIPPDNPDQVADRSAKFLENGDKTTIHFQPGISLDRIVDSILSTTEKFQKELKGTSEPDTLQTPENEIKKAITQLLPRVIADSQIIGWDKGRKDYARKYRYLITSYEMRTLQTPANEKASLGSQQRYELLRERGRLKKVYHYIYTGRNDQVLDFDLTFNFNWYAALPLQAGIYTNFSTNETGAIATPNDTAESKVEMETSGKAMEAKPAATSEDTFASATGFDIRSYSSSFGANLNIAKSNFTNEINNGLQDIEDQGELIAKNSPGIADALSNTGISASNARDFLSSQKASAPFTGIDFSQQDPALEDLYSGERDVNPLIVSYVETASGQNENLTADHVSTPGRTMLSALFEQAKSPTSGDLLNIDLRIKGDPYWIEPAPVGRSEGFLTTLDRELRKRGLDPTSVATGAVPVTPEDTDAEILDAATSQVFILFRCFTPQNFDPESGITPKFTDSNVLNGFYGVRVVQHEFSQGQFVQTVSAIRDPLISINDVRLEDIDDPSFNNATNAAEARGDIPGADDIAGAVREQNLANIAQIEPPAINLDNGASKFAKFSKSIQEAGTDLLGRFLGNG